MNQIIELFLPTTIKEAPDIIKILLYLLSFSFIIFYLYPFFKQKNLLEKAIKDLKKHKKTIQQDRNNGEQVFSNEDFKEAWHEYSQTLQLKNEKERSSVPSESFFNKTRFVDKVLHVEFFKHLPGILTGLGIIGTFWEVIQGLRSFHLNGDPTVVSNSVQNLLDNVWHGFLASLIGVGLSVIITVFEKLFIKILYNKIDKLNQTIDNIFDYGYNEENLEELLKSNKEIKELSDKQLTEAKMMKDSLVTEISTALKNLSDELSGSISNGFDKSIGGFNASLSGLGDTIGKSINENLKEPIQHLFLYY